MARQSNRDRLLHAGLKVVHAHGFAGASVRDIVRAAGVPQGSFTNHFGSKEAFGLEVIDLYAKEGEALLNETLLNAALPPLARIAAFIDLSGAQFCSEDMQGGCLLGNFAAEAGEHSEALRRRLSEKFAATREAIAAALRAAVAAGELPADFDCDGVAAFIQSGMQGATLLGKAEASNGPLQRFKAVLFEKVLR